MAEQSPHAALSASARPWSLKAFAVLYLVTALYWAAYVSGWRADSLVWLGGLAAVYLLWRGSTPALLVSAIALGAFTIQSAVYIEKAMTPGGHHPLVHVVEAALLLALLVLLLLPQTRAFCAAEPPRG